MGGDSVLFCPRFNRSGESEHGVLFLPYPLLIDRACRRVRGVWTEGKALFA